MIKSDASEGLAERHLRVKPDPAGGERFAQIAPARFAECGGEIINACRRIPSLLFTETLPLRISKYHSAIEGENGQALLHRFEQGFIKRVQRTQLRLQLPKQTHLPVQVSGCTTKLCTQGSRQAIFLCEFGRFKSNLQ